MRLKVFFPGSLPRVIILLGFVSFFNDVASEMILPLLPVFLTVTLGAGTLVIGLIEGLAEATSSLLKMASGYWVDRGWRIRPLVLGGYSGSNLARPLIGLATAWWGVLLLRFADRVGKGLRTTARDTLIATATTAENRGTAFGWHRALDNAGAMFGPLVAYVLLSAGHDLRQVFLLSFIPGVLALLLLLRALPSKLEQRPRPISVSTPRLAWTQLDPSLRSLVAAASILSFAALPEVFIVILATAHEVPLVHIPLLWAAMSGLKALVALPAGMLSDRWGRLPVLRLGWLLRLLMLLLLAWLPLTGSGIWLLILVYGISLAFTEGAERALIGDRAPTQQTGGVYGAYHMGVGLAALPGAVLLGFVWQFMGAAEALSLSAILSLFALVWFNRRLGQ